MKKNIRDWDDEEAVEDYLVKLLRKEAFDQRGLIYGMGHAVYSISDPRATIFKKFVEQLAREKGRDKDFRLYSMVEELAPKIIARERHIYKGVSANVDFTAVLYTACLIFRWSFILQCLRLPGLPGGAHIGWKN